MTNHQSSDDQPLQELKHDAVPGYPMIFTICFAVMGIYLAIILYSSPGQVDHGHDYKKDDGDHPAKHQDANSEEKPHK